MKVTLTLLTGAFVLLSLGCDPGSGFTEGGGQPQKPSKQSEDQETSASEEKDDDEDAQNPATVSGVFLRCAELNVANGREPGKSGCGLYKSKESSELIDLEVFEASGVEVAVDDDRVTVEPAGSDNIKYHAFLFYLKGVDIDQVEVSSEIKSTKKTYEPVKKKYSETKQVVGPTPN